MGTESWDDFDLATRRAMNYDEFPGRHAKRSDDGTPAFADYDNIAGARHLSYWSRQGGQGP